jgi:hypothetical protein
VRSKDAHLAETYGDAGTIHGKRHPAPDRLPKTGKLD